MSDQHVDGRNSASGSIPSTSSSATMSGKMLDSPDCEPTESALTLETSPAYITILVKRQQKFQPKQRIYLRNDLLLIVGYLEFFNALDFPANVWNTIPVPTFAIGLMATGGSIALIASSTAFIDLWKSWRNLVALKKERSFLRQRLDRLRQIYAPVTSVQHTQAWSSLNLREYGWELIDRSLMDGLVGFAAILVGVGTLMAVGGANPKIYLASNLLSGYIGNGFVALYSLVNAAWSAYLYNRAKRHKRLTRTFITESTMRKRAIRTFRLHQLYAILNGITLVVSGAASLITATHWWGYPMLIPCIVSSAFCNILWRRRIGYNRVLQQYRSSDTLEFDIYATVQDVVRTRTADQDNEVGILCKDLDSLTSSSELIAVMDSKDLLEDLVVKIANTPTTRGSLNPDLLSKTEVTIDRQMLESVDLPALAYAAKSVVRECRSDRLRDQERCLYELLGAYLHIREQSKAVDRVEPSTEEKVEQRSQEP